MSECPTLNNYDKLLHKRTCAIINSYTFYELPGDVKLWYHENNGWEEFNKIDFHKGLQGYLPRNIASFLVKMSITSKEKVEQCIRRLSKVIKWNRYVTWKKRWKLDAEGGRHF